MTLVRNLALGAIIALLATPVAAHEGEAHMAGMKMSGTHMDNMMGMHDMKVTVSAVDAKTGIVNVNANGMLLRIHFPPASLANVKSGDKITVHLSFTKP